MNPTTARGLGGSDTVTTLRRWAPLVYYGGLGLLLVLIVTGTLTDIVPGTVGRHIGYDSEGYLFALVLPAWIEFARPRLSGRGAEWPVTLLVAVAVFGAFLFLYTTTSVTGSITTLNETVLALALLIPYVQPWRRPSPAVATVVGVVVLAVTVGLDHSSLVWLPTNLAEGLFMLMLAPIAFDVTDRGILRPERPSPWRVRVTWWAFLLAFPLLVVLLRHFVTSGVLGDALRFAARPQEAFVGMLLIELYFAVRRLGS